MDTDALDNYLVYIDSIFSKLVGCFNKLQLEDHTVNTIQRGGQLIQRGTSVLTSIKTHAKYIENMLVKCSEFVNEVKSDLGTDSKSDLYVFMTKNGMLGYPGKEFITLVPPAAQPQPNSATHSPNSNSANPTPASIQKPAKPVERVIIPEVGCYLNITEVADLTKIPPAIYSHKSKLYMRLPNNVIVQVPFPEIVDSKKEYDRKHSIRCKYNTLDECTQQRTRIAKMYNSALRACNFAHHADSIIKIGYMSRCPSVPNFGNPATLASDVKYVTEADAKNLLLYGLNDVISAVIWMEYANKANTEYVNLDVC